LVAHLTGHDIIDYSAMSDFFLAFRIFLSADQLLELLFTRLAWAVDLHDRSRTIEGGVGGPGSSATRDETGRDVCVRTFVMLRHWVLNFFADDFVPSFRLRSKFSGAINRLYMWNKVQDDTQIRRIFEQLKKTWIRACCMYWNLGSPSEGHFDLSLPIFPGGMFGTSKIGRATAGAPTANPEARRLTLLSFYKGPIKPVLSSSDLRGNSVSAGRGPLLGMGSADAYGTVAAGTATDWSLSGGSLIKGGITLSGDVAVSHIKPLTPLRKAEQQAKTSRSLKTLITSWKNKRKGAKVFGKLAGAMAGNDASGRRPGSGSDLDVRIDILSARVIEELDYILKLHASQNFNGSARPNSMSRDSDVSPVKRQRFSRQSQRPNSIQHSTTSSFRKRVSLIDSLRIGDHFAHTSSEESLLSRGQAVDFDFTEPAPSDTAS
jgi:hypothetical protein